MSTSRKTNETSVADRPRFNLITSDRFNRTKYAHEWLIDGILVKGQPGVIGGPKKSLKTSLVIDMAISLGTGKPFLGVFPVSKAVTVAVFSGESGKASLQETAQRVARAKRVKLDDHCRVHWEFTLPRLNDRKDRIAFKKAIRATRAQVVFLDPLYLCLLNGGPAANASNLFEVGPILSAAAEACLGAGATPIFVHHTTKAAGAAKPLGLDDLAFAGIGEYARQWVLVNRLETYTPGSGNHHLGMSVGGSAGHSSYWEMSILEGSTFNSRRWDVTVGGAKGQVIAQKATRNRKLQKWEDVYDAERNTLRA